MTFSGPTLRFEKDNIIAITGASMSPCVNGNPIPMYQAVLVRAGETLSFGMTNGNGSRAYLAFAGGLDVPLVMGSKSTLMRNQLGGIEGRKLEKGDSIGFVSPKTTLPNMEMRKFEPEVFPKKELTLRVVTGPQDTDFTEEELRRSFWYGAEITNESDRMMAGFKGRAAYIIRRRQYHYRRNRIWLDPGTFEWAADHHAGRPAEHGRLQQDRNRHLDLPKLGHRACRTQSAFRKDRHWSSDAESLYTGSRN